MASGDAIEILIWSKLCVEPVWPKEFISSFICVPILFKNQ